MKLYIASLILSSLCLTYLILNLIHVLKNRKWRKELEQLDKEYYTEYEIYDKLIERNKQLERELIEKMERENNV